MKNETTIKDKLFNYGITIGLIISLIGFILLKTDLVNENYTNHVHYLYKLTLILSIIFILTKSLFVKDNFNQILKVVGFIFLVILGINLLKEFNIYDIEPILTIAYILFSSLLIMYTYHFLKKKNKKQLDYLKLGLITILFVGGFLNLLNLLPNNLNYISGGLFWVVVLGMIYINHEKENGIKKHVA